MAQMVQMNNINTNDSIMNNINTNTNTTLCYVYFLSSTDGSTYIGATIDLKRRLRQHNGEIKGGAKRTTMKIAKGETWERLCYVGGFPDWKAALQFEWRWKQLSRKKQYSMMNPIQRRTYALDELIHLNSSTNKAIPYKDWDVIPTIYLENTNKMDFIKEIINYNNIEYVEKYNELL